MAKDIKSLGDLAFSALWEADHINDLDRQMQEARQKAADLQALLNKYAFKLADIVLGNNEGMIDLGNSRVVVRYWVEGTGYYDSNGHEALGYMETRVFKEAYPDKGVREQVEKELRAELYPEKETEPPSE